MPETTDYYIIGQSASTATAVFRIIRDTGFLRPELWDSAKKAWVQWPRLMRFLYDEPGAEKVSQKTADEVIARL